MPLSLSLPGRVIHPDVEYLKALVVHSCYNCRGSRVPPCQAVTRLSRCHLHNGADRVRVLGGGLRGRVGGREGSGLLRGSVQAAEREREQ
jgi:hypothetical protein